MGKTTFAKRVAFLLATKYKSDARGRIPILIRLEELGSEQSLEGLLGKHFTSYAVIQNYTFQIFMELNRRGRFALFLDGFDEMKQGLSWETLRYNFQQLNRLIDGEAKVVMSGRPSIFLNEEEYNETLHGVRKVLSDRKPIPGSANYVELHLAPFSESQIQEFIDLYAASSGRSPTEPRVSRARAARTTGRDRLKALAGRPVQLKMLLELYPSWDERVDNLTATILYSEFIDLIIRREMSKQARRRFSLNQRREFAAALAWWMWKEHNGRSVSAGKLPDVLITPYLNSGDDVNDAKRDLLSACFVEAKQPDGYFFPHRSFQEFLVAERIALLVKERSFTLNEDIQVTPELRDFLIELLQEDQSRLRQLVWPHRGALADWIADVILGTVESPEQLIDESGPDCPWGVLLCSLGLHRGLWPKSASFTTHFLKTVLDGRGGHSAEWMSLLVILNVMLSPEISVLGFNAGERIERLMKSAGTWNRFEGKRVLEDAPVISAHICGTFCCLASWLKAPPHFGRRRYVLPAEIKRFIATD